MKATLRTTFLALAGTLLLWAAYLGIVALFFKRNGTASGEFGDTFGALNTLFTGWAFVVVLSTLILQSRQIAETKRDLDEERQLQKRTSELVAEQAKALASQVRLNALVARIEAYHVQIRDAGDRGDNTLKTRLAEERLSLMRRLDEVLRSYGD